MDTWDDEKLRKVVSSKSGNPRTTTDVRVNAIEFDTTTKLSNPRSSANFSSRLSNRKSKPVSKPVV